MNIPLGNNYVYFSWKIGESMITCRNLIRFLTFAKFINLRKNLYYCNLSFHTVKIDSEVRYATKEVPSDF